MDMVLALALVLGVMVAAWVKVSPLLGVYWFIGAIGLACFYAAGGRMNGLKKAIPAGLAGMAFAAAAELFSILSGHPELEWIALGVATVLVVIASKWSLLAFLPAGLCGISLVGAGGVMGIMDLVTNAKLAIAFVAGMVAGYIAEMIAGMVGKKA
jgi:Protein of unknown function (DUF1097)